MDYLNAYHDNTPNVTLTILPVSLSLVHIPRHRLREFSHPILQHILRPAPTFLNISCNATEVSIIAERETVEPFVKAARRDLKKIERRRRKAAGRSSGAAARSRGKRELKPVEVSSTWSALQIDSHGDQIGDATARIREISALLSGISILYQSSYTTDFIFVQSARLPKVITILTEARFLPRSSSYAGLMDRSRNNTNTSHSPSSSSSSSIYSPISRERSSSFPYLDDETEAETWADDRGRGRSRRDTTATTTTTTSSHTANSIHSLTSKLQLTGLDAVAAARPVVPPVLLPPVKFPTSTQKTTPRGYSFSPGNRPDICVLPSDLVVVGLSDDSDAWATKLIRLLLFSEEVQAAVPSARKERTSFDEPKKSNGVGEPKKVFPTMASVPERRPAEDEDDEEDNASYHSLDEDEAVADDVSESSGSESDSDASCLASSSSTSQPFFSLTRTCLYSSSTSSSLTSDIHLLAALFPPNERHWIFCADEFERLGIRDGDEFDEGENDGVEERDEGSFLRCLHVDLQDFGLDRHGLVNRFSTLLHEENIHHLYSSTFKTANLLVSEKDAARALEVLQSC